MCMKETQKKVEFIKLVQQFNSADDGDSDGGGGGDDNDDDDGDGDGVDDEN